jgi:hypothetical protein
MSDAPKTRIDFDAIKRAVPVERAAEAFVPGLKFRRQGGDLVALSPLKTERTPSFRINVRKGQWFCFATNQGGDVIRLVEKILNVSPVDAARAIADRCMAGGVPTLAVEDGAARAKREAEREAERQRQAAEDQMRAEDRIGHARAIWTDTRPAAGTLVETYLAARGIDLDALAAVYGWRVPPNLRFHPRCTVGPRENRHIGPAMVAVMVDERGRFRGIHRTFLTKDGAAKAGIESSKAMLGVAWGAATPVTPLMHVAADRLSPDALIGEGFETTLTVVAALAREGRAVQAYVGLSLGNICGAGLGDGRPHPAKRGQKLPATTPDPDRPGMILPAHIRRVTILEDADGKDPLAFAAHMTRAAAKFTRLGLSVRTATPPRGLDFNDMARVA